MQDAHDLIYVGNGSGVLEYDSVSWRLIPVSNESVVRSLAAGTDGRIFVGGVAELGYLAPDASGRMSYVSLADRIAPEDRDFSDVWRVDTTSDGVYFRSIERLFRWDGREMRAWRTEEVFWQIFTLDDVLYVQQRGVGLLRMDGDSLVMMPGGSWFHDKRIAGLIPHGEDEYLAVTRQHGMFRCPLEPGSESTCQAQGPDSTEQLIALQPYHATSLPDGTLAIATVRDGVALLDPTGRLLRVLNEDTGLRDQEVKYCYVDRQGGLWLALSDGLARVEIGAPLSYWDKASGLTTVLDVVRHRDRLHVAINAGVYTLTPGGKGIVSRFQPHPDTPAQCWALLSTSEGLLAACGDGLYNLDHQKLIASVDPSPILAIHRSKKDPTVLYLGFYGGLSRMRLRDGQWTDLERIDSVQARIYAIAEDDQGRLWLGTDTDGVVRIEQNASDPVATRFGVADGLKAGPANTFTIGGRVAVVSGKGGLMRQAATAETAGPSAAGFVTDTTFDAFLPHGSAGIKRLTEDDQGQVWIAAGTDSGVARPTADGGYEWTPIALRQAPTRDIWCAHAEPDALWLGGPHGLIRYDTSHASDAATSFPIWIRRVTTSAGSPIYDGRPRDLQGALPYQDNSLRFAFAAPRYSSPEHTHYRVRVDGLDDDWSAWTAETDKDYTHLWEGRYVFRVQARDIYGNLSREDSFAFRILPPWYRSWWAYLLYGLALAAAIGVFVRSQQKKVERQRAIAQMERDAAERERAVNRRLREVDKLKDEFLANTSHELRTPLYGMTGLAESMIDGATGELSDAVKVNLSMIAGSGRRLSHLVNEILDFSKLQHGSLQLDRRPVDLHTVVDVVLTLSEGLVGSKGLSLVNAVPRDLPAADADENRLQQILYNLVGNAIKFTEEGSVEVSASAAGGQLVVRVADTGIGIPEDQHERIFDAFEQADGTVEREYGGTGLGLALTRRLVERHGGKIDLESAPGEGSTFTFRLPVATESAEAPSSDAHPVFAGGNAPDETIAPSVASSAGGPRVLVVDDEPVNLQVVRNYLEVEEFDLTLASSGEEALSLLEEKTFDLVLLDVMMPKISGYEVCRSLRVKHSLSDLPVIFLTAKTQDADVVTGMSLGANDYLTKPVSKDRLLARIRPHLEILRLHRDQEALVEEKMAQVKVLSGLLPICAGCKKIRDDQGYWNQLEVFLDRHSEASFSHGMCPECVDQYFAERPWLRSDEQA